MKRFILIIVILLLFGCSSNANKNEEESKGTTNILQALNQLTKETSNQNTFRIVEEKDVFGDKTGDKHLVITIFGVCKEFGLTETVRLDLNYLKAKNKKDIIVISDIHSVESTMQKIITSSYKIEYKTNNGTKKKAVAIPLANQGWVIFDNRQESSSIEFLNCLLYSENIQVYMESEEYPTNTYRFDIDTKNFKSLYDTYFKNK